MTKDGGQAFPGENTGMSLRDWFAGQALSNMRIISAFSRSDMEKMADSCYRMADAMIDRRGEAD